MKADQQKLRADFDVQDEQFAAVQSTKKRRLKCVIVIITVLVIAVVVAIVVPLVLLYKDEQTSEPKTNSTILTPPVTDEEWSSWSVCSVTCGNGTRKRTRICSGSADSSCSVTREMSTCQMPPCSEPASWGQWSQWSPCSKTCAEGTQTRNRSCSNKGELGKDGQCNGDERQTRNCTLAECTKIDCLDWLRSGQRTNGIYKVDPDGRGSFSVYCDMTTDGGGWTVFQRRQDGSEEFYLTWNDYKTGFGNMSGEFWLGNEKLHRLTTSLNASLCVLIGDWSGGLHNASYQVFRVGAEKSNYSLTALSYSGNAGDSMTEHNGMMFTTKDRDNDKEKFSNCAVAYHGGWWYKACIKSNLNGKYAGDNTDRQGVIWLTLSKAVFKSMKTTKMMLRPDTTVSSRSGEALLE